jgi:pimeloyl-ACP methyl ester carboxylesterase
VFAAGEPGARPLLLVHGTAGDHRTWRVVAPLLATGRRVLAMDRRGHGDSGDAPGWAIDRELEDMAAMAEAVAGEAGGPVDVIGHSLGGRIALAASLRTSAIRRVVAYEGAPGAERADTARLVAHLRTLLGRGALDELLATFMTDAVGMPADELAAFRANPIWARRVATGPTVVRELEAADTAPAIGLDALAGVAVPVLQLVGSESSAWFRDGAAALGARLAQGRLEVIDGARHAAHHSHPAAFVGAVERFLDA